MTVFVNGSNQDLAAKADLASPTFTGTVTAAAVTTTGNTVLGNASGDTFKTHGTAEAGTQAANVTAASQTSADTSPITAASVDTTAAKLTDVQALQVDYDKMIIDMAAVVSKLNSSITCLKTHGLMSTT